MRKACFTVVIAAFLAIAVWMTTLAAAPVGWLTYRSADYAFELKYPADLEPLIQNALANNDPILPLTYMPPSLNALQRICFAPVSRKELSCEIELYVSDHAEQFTRASSQFLGLPRAAVEDSSFARESFGGGMRATVVQTSAGIAGADNIINVYGMTPATEGTSYVYLFTVRMPSPTTLKRLHSMLDSFTSLNTK